MTPAEIEEQAEIRMLREQADEAARQVGDTLAVLAARIAQTGGPRAWARRWLAAMGGNLLAAVGRCRQAIMKGAGRQALPRHLPR